MDDFLKMIQNYGQNMQTNIDQEQGNLTEIDDTSLSPISKSPDQTTKFDSQQGNQQIDPRLQEAFAERDRRERMAMLLSGFKGLAQAGVASSGSNYKIDDSMEKAMMQRAQNPVKDVQSQIGLQQTEQKLKQDQERHQNIMNEYSQKLAMGGFELDNQERLMDPNSKESKFAQNYLTELNPNIAKEEIEGIPAAQLYKNFLPQMQQLVLGKMNIDARRAALEQQERRTRLIEEMNEIRRQKEQNIDRRFEKTHDYKTNKFDWQKDEKDELSDKQVEIITEFDIGSNIINEIKNKYKLPNVQDSLGFYASKLSESKKYIPFAERDPDFVQMQALVGTQLADYVKRISGAAVSEQEAQRLAKNIPSMEDKPQEFMKKLETFEEILNKNRKTTVDSINKQGKTAGGFAKESQTSTESQFPDVVKMQIPDGRIKLIPRNQVEAAKKAGAKEI